MKILIFDLETAPNIAATWGIWKQNIGVEMIETDWHIMSYAAKWLGNDKIHYNDARKNVGHDYKLLSELHKLLDEADAVIAHNAIKFDVKKVNARFITEGFTPPSPYKVIDTLQEAKKHFAFTSNKLQYLTDRLCTEKKMSHAKFPGYKLWAECLKGNQDAWEEMKTYNIQDIVSLEELYLKMRPWMTNHPVVGLTNAPTGEHHCPKCGSIHVQKRGFSTTSAGIYQRYQCNDCGGWSRSRYALNSKQERLPFLTNAVN